MLKYKKQTHLQKRWIIKLTNTIMNLIQHDRHDNDFLIEGNHARMSYRKVAEITKVSLDTVHSFVKKSSVNSKNTGSTPIQMYFSGVRLKDFVTYLDLDAQLRSLLASQFFVVWGKL